MKQIFTIGVYGYTSEEFFGKLQKNNIDTFCDIRLRRGVRGAEYAFANSKRLQNQLAELGIRYLHFPELAPTEEMVKLQGEADKKQKIPRRKRLKLSNEFISSYTSGKLVDFDLEAFVSQLPDDCEKAAFFCVEIVPQACHRSLFADKLSSELDISVKHL
jgi:uncharacterized protein (DUF488 family)